IDEGRRDDVAVGGRAGLERRDHAVLDRDPEALVAHPALDDDIRLGRLPGEEHHATPAAVSGRRRSRPSRWRGSAGLCSAEPVSAASTGAGPWTSRSYRTAIRTTRPLRTWVVTSAST